MFNERLASCLHLHPRLGFHHRKKAFRGWRRLGWRGQLTETKDQQQTRTPCVHSKSKTDSQPGAGAGARAEMTICAATARTAQEMGLAFAANIAKRETRNGAPMAVASS